jgi:cytochrome c553
VRNFEIIVSSLFLITGIYLSTQLPLGNKYDYLFYIKVVMVLVAIPAAIIGFKRSNKILAALSLLLITGSFGIAEAYSKRKATPKENGTLISANDGKSLYESNCSKCHGKDGKLGMAGAMDLTATQLEVNSIAQIILHGRGAMVPVAVSEEQAKSISEYVAGTIKGH